VGTDVGVWADASDARSAKAHIVGVWADASGASAKAHIATRRQWAAIPVYF
jgi:hypothetical protein